MRVCVTFLPYVTVGVSLALPLTGSALLILLMAGFFGCCYHCKHSPECTQKCMSKHNIPNGSGEADPDLPAESVELLQITEEIEPLHKHNEKKSEKQEVAAAGKALRKESKDNKPFQLHAFFNCVFGCQHEIKCSRTCLKRHGIADHFVPDSMIRDMVDDAHAAVLVQQQEFELSLALE